MFLYACGVSRVHQEFELFEQILKGKIVLILKKKKGGVVVFWRRELKVADKKVSFLSRSFFLSCFPSTLFSPLLSSVVETRSKCLSTCQRRANSKKGAYTKSL